MMRKIKFRGMTRKKGEKVRLDGSPVDGNWVYGGIFFNNNGGDFSVIYQQYPEIKKFSVYSDTVGQYTGLHDKNGKEIYEGDIVAVDDFYGKVIFDEEELCFCIEWVKGMHTYYRKDIKYWCNDDNFQVVGSVYENADLLN